jgi:SRSO17 transposase
MLWASVLHILSKYGIRSGRLIIDDTDNERSKNTSKIAKAHKIKDKRTGEYFNGQNIVLLLLVSKELTIPLSFRFFEPDPALREWRLKDKCLRSNNVAKKDRPKKPSRNPDYPKKWELALAMIVEFKKRLPNFIINAIVADAAYGNKDFSDTAKTLINRPQVISQIAKTQLIMVDGKYVPTKPLKTARTLCKLR